jgi:acetolactate synthase-1/2/3 large subunit
MGAYLDSSPMIVVSGQVNDASDRDRQKGIQEIRTCLLVKEHTKIIRHITPEMREGQIDTALKYMQFKRPGPAWLSIPLNIQNSEVTCKE